MGSVSGSKAAEADLGLRMLAGDAIPLTRDYRAEPLQPLQPLQPLHREMAVDVPDSFIARSKTPPRYPPPRPVVSTAALTMRQCLWVPAGLARNHAAAHARSRSRSPTTGSQQLHECESGADCARREARPRFRF